MKKLRFFSGSLQFGSDPLGGDFELEVFWIRVESALGEATDFSTAKSLGIQSPKLRMVMEAKYLAEEVIIHPNHQLTR